LTRRKLPKATKPIDWATKVANPEAIGVLEARQWIRVEPVLARILDELWELDKVETLFEPKEKALLRLCIEKQDDFGRIYNLLVSLFESREKAEDFTKIIEKFGFTESQIVLNFIFVAISLTVLKIELFKLILLFHMKVEDKSVARFNSTMQESAPRSWKKLKPFVDSPLRNALAHGTYTVQPGKITVFKSAELNSPVEMSFGQFMLKIKTQDVLLQCLINVLQDRGLYALP
jgi:hypothetical protein